MQSLVEWLTYRHVIFGGSVVTRSIRISELLVNALSIFSRERMVVMGSGGTLPENSVYWSVPGLVFTLGETARVLSET